MLLSSSTASVHAAWLDRMDIFFGPRSQDWAIPRAMIKAKPGLYVLAVLSNPTGEWISSYFFSFGPDIHVFRTPPSVAGAGLDISCGYAIRGAQGPRPRRRCFSFFIPRRLKRWLLVAPTSSLHLLCSITTHTHTIGFSFLWQTTDTTSSIREDLAYNTPPSFMPPARSQSCALGGVSGFQLVYPILAIRSAICGKPDVCGRCRPTRSHLPIADIRFLPALSLKIARLSWYTASTLF